MRRRLRVCVFSTGDEVAAPGGPLPPGRLYDANRALLCALTRRAGAEVSDGGILADSAQATARALREAADTHDLVLTSGGVSTGEEDHVKAVVNSLGSIDMWKLAIKPGKPLALGHVGGTPFLSGNAILERAALLVAHAGMGTIWRLSPRAEPTLGIASCAGASTTNLCLGGNGGRELFITESETGSILRARLEIGADGRPVAHKFPSDSSGVLTSMVEADGLVDMPESASAIRPGDMVDFLPFTGLFA